MREEWKVVRGSMMAATGRNESSNMSGNQSLEDVKLGRGEVERGCGDSQTEVPSCQIASEEDEAERNKEHRNENCGEKVNAEEKLISKEVNEEIEFNLDDVKVPQKVCCGSGSPEDFDETYFSYRKPLSSPAAASSPFLPRCVAANRKKLQGPAKRTESDSNVKERRKVESETSTSSLKKVVASKEEQEKNDSENNFHSRKALEEAKSFTHAEVLKKKKSLAQLVQKKLNQCSSLEKAELKSNTGQPVQFDTDKKVKVEEDPTCTRLVISILKHNFSSKSQKKLVQLVKRTGKLVKHRFSESGSRCWLQLESEEQASETLVALDGLLWEGSRLVASRVVAEDGKPSEAVNPSCSQPVEKRKKMKDTEGGQKTRKASDEGDPLEKKRILKDERVSGSSYKVRWGTLRMEEEEEERRKRKRARDENTEYRKKGRTEEDWRKRRAD